MSSMHTLSLPQSRKVKTKTKTTATSLLETLEKRQILRKTLATTEKRTLGFKTEDKPVDCSC